MSAQRSLNDRLILVTGASRGIGRATAVEIARRGGHVIALARTQGGLEELDDEIKALGAEATLVPADVRDGDGLDRLGAAIFQRWGRLDGLVANAGLLGPLSPLGHVAPNRWDETIATNLTANYRLVRALDPVLRKGDDACAVFVTSGAARAPKAFWGAYAASKAGLEALATAYAAETEKTGPRVVVFNPGPVRTAMRAKAMPGEDPTRLPAPDVIAVELVDWLEPGRRAEPGQVITAQARLASSA